MRTKFFSMVLSAMVLATASVGITASADEAVEMPDTANTVVEEVTNNPEDIEDFTETADKPKNAASAEKSADNLDNNDDSNMEKYHEIMDELADSEGMPDYENDPYYDTDGNATLIKSEKIVYNSEEMQFIAVTTKDGHVFYVLINYSAENGEDNVYFLNRVDDYDLYALLYAGDESDDESENITPEQVLAAAQAANGRVQVDTATAVPETDDSADETVEGEQVTTKPNAVNPNSIYILIGAVVLIGAAAGFFFFKKKGGGKSVVKETVEEDDEDDITFPDDENY